jgi:FixJ family two-component response regulator
VYETAEHFLAARPRAAAACLILDIRMPGMGGLELQRELLERGPRVPIVFVTAHGDIALAVRAIKQGAFDFIEKPFQGKALLSIIENAVRSGSASTASAAQQLQVQARIAALSEREHAVMTRVLAGKTNKRIANELAISVKTVEYHRSRMMEKLGVTSIAELVRLVVSHSAGLTESL